LRRGINAEIPSPLLSTAQRKERKGSKTKS
jgi:hypothetical protein